MSWPDNPHGKRSTAQAAKRSRQISVKLQGGPRGGDVINYPEPLPKTLVVHSKTAGWVDYQRKPATTTYVFADEIPPEADHDD